MLISMVLKPNMFKYMNNSRYYFVDLRIITFSKRRQDHVGIETGLQTLK